MTHFLVMRGLPLLWILWTLPPLWLTFQCWRIFRDIEKVAQALPRERPLRQLRITLAHERVVSALLRMVVLGMYAVIGMVAVLSIPPLWARIIATIALFVSTAIFWEKSRRELHEHRREMQMLAIDEVPDRPLREEETS